VSRFPVPVPPAGLPYTNFCDKGGRFGPHNQNQLQYNPYVQEQGNLAYLTWFNAGLRVYDVSDQRLPREIGFELIRFVPLLETTLVEQIRVRFLEFGPISLGRSRASFADHALASSAKAEAHSSP